MHYLEPYTLSRYRRVAHIGQDSRPKTQDPRPKTQDPGPRIQDPGPRFQDPWPRKPQDAQNGHKTDTDKRLQNGSGCARSRQRGRSARNRPRPKTQDPGPKTQDPRPRTQDRNRWIAAGSLGAKTLFGAKPLSRCRVARTAGLQSKPIRNPLGLFGLTFTP